MSQQPTQGGSQATGSKATRRASRSPPDSTRTQSHVGPAARAPASNSGFKGPWAADITERTLRSAESKGYLPLDYPAYGDGVIDEGNPPKGYKVVYECEGCRVDVERHIELWVHQLGCMFPPETFMSTDSQRPWLVPQNYVFVKEPPLKIVPLKRARTTATGWKLRYGCAGCIRSAKEGVIRWQAQGFANKEKANNHRNRCHGGKEVPLNERYVDAKAVNIEQTQERYDPPAQIKQQLQQLSSQAPVALKQEWFNDVIKPRFDAANYPDGTGKYHRCPNPSDLNFWSSSGLKTHPQPCTIQTDPGTNWDMLINWVMLKQVPQMTRGAKIDPTKVSNVVARCLNTSHEEDFPLNDTEGRRKFFEHMSSTGWDCLGEVQEFRRQQMLQKGKSIPTNQRNTDDGGPGPSGGNHPGDTGGPSSSQGPGPGQGPGSGSGPSRRIDISQLLNNNQGGPQDSNEATDPKDAKETELKQRGRTGRKRQAGDPTETEDKNTRTASTTGKRDQTPAGSKKDKPPAAGSGTQRPALANVDANAATASKAPSQDKTKSSTDKTKTDETKTKKASSTTATKSLAARPKSKAEKKNDKDKTPAATAKKTTTAV